MKVIVSNKLSMKNSKRFAVSFDACLTMTIDLQILQTAVRIGHTVTRRRWKIVEMEVDDFLIVAKYTYLLEKFQNEALQKILLRYIWEEFAVLQEIEYAM